MSDELMKKIHSGFDHIESVQISTTPRRKRRGHYTLKD
jgi:hypothetical protein